MFQSQGVLIVIVAGASAPCFGMFQHGQLVCLPQDGVFQPQGVLIVIVAGASVPCFGMFQSQGILIVIVAGASVPCLIHFWNMKPKYMLYYLLRELSLGLISRCHAPRMRMHAHVNIDSRL